MSNEPTGETSCARCGRTIQKWQGNSCFFCGAAPLPEDLSIESMIEPVAIAIYTHMAECETHDRAWRHPHEPPWDSDKTELSEWERDDYRSMAKRAILATFGAVAKGAFEVVAKGAFEVVAKGTLGAVAKGTFAQERVVTIFVREDSCESDFPQVIAAFDPWDEALGINILKAGVLQALGHGTNIADVIRFVIVRKS